MRILVEGWLSAPHSYTTVNQFQCLALLQRPAVRLFHEERPLAHGWQRIAGQLDESRSRQLAEIPPPDRQPVDRLLRMDSPYRLRPTALADRLLVFATTEFGKLHHEYWQWMGARSWAEAGGHEGAIVVTPSEWSRQGLIRSGAAPDRVAVVPHGIDPAIYHPLATGDRAALRRTLGWAADSEDHFVLLNVGGTIPRKGGDRLIQALAATVERYPQVRLVLKANDAVYGSDRGAAAWVRQVRSLLPDGAAQALLDRTAYLNKFLSYDDMARLYQAADGYLSPYRAEGFNLPVLEAIGCGLPVICTEGGPTDEFTRPEFALPIASRLTERPVQYHDGVSETVWMWEPDLDSTIAQLAALIDRPAWRDRARVAGPDWVRSRYTWQQAVDRLLAL